MTNLLEQLEIIWDAVALGYEYGARCFADRMTTERVLACSHRTILK